MFGIRGLDSLGFVHALLGAAALLLGLAVLLRPKGAGVHPRIGRGYVVSMVALNATALMIYVWVYSTTYYELTADELIVHSGPIRRAVPLSSLQRLRATHNPLSAPALSLDRIEVTYGSRRVLISPRDKRAFVNAVVRRAPAVVLDGLSTT
jgi:hypothetical protein